MRTGAHLPEHMPDYPPDSREAEVLAAMRWLGPDFGPMTAEVVARCLSLRLRGWDCEWAPLVPLPRRRPVACRRVPPKSKEAVRLVLTALQAAGLLRSSRGHGNFAAWEIVEDA